MPAKKSELRKDYIQDKYVIIAPRRGKRPHDTKKPVYVKKQHEKKVCVFCPENIDKEEHIMTVGPAKKNWKIKVLKNKFPAVRLDNKKAYGTQEVVIETPNHQLELEELSIDHITKLLDIYAIRTKELSKIKDLEYILIFKNNGGVAGASLQHAHSQIFATSFLPPHIYDKSSRTHAYKIKTGRCAYCDVIEDEKKKKERIIWEDDNVIVFSPYAARYNYEVWIMPKKHHDNITLLNAKEKKSFAKALKNVLTAIGYLNLPYNYYFHQVINDNDQHLYMKIVPRGSTWAGVEIGSGIVINPISPEDAAKFYRDCFNGVCQIKR